MIAYTIYWCNTDNLIGVVTTDATLTDEEVLGMFVSNYPAYKGDKNLLVGRPVKGVRG